MKTLRIILSVILLLIFVAIMGIGSLFLFIDPNKLKPVIAEQVKNRTGYGVQIDGQFAWSFYPRVGIKAEHIVLYSPKQATPFIDLQGVIFITELKELLHGKRRLRGDIYISSLKLLNAIAKNAHVGLKWKNEILTLSLLSADFYAGQAWGVAYGRDLARSPYWDWEMQFKNVQVKPLLQDINGADSKLQLSGLGQLTFLGHSQGKSQEQIMNNLNGALAFNLTNGILEGTDLNYFVQSADAIISKQPLASPTNNLDQTTFDSLLGSVTIRNGVAEVNALTLTSPTFITRAHGSVNLPYQAVNLQLQITTQQTMRAQWAIPVMLTGSLVRPDIRLDTTELNIIVAKKELDKAKSGLSEEVKKQLSSDTGQLFNKILIQ